MSGVPSISLWIGLWIGGSVLAALLIAAVVIAWLGARLPAEHVARGELEIATRLDALWDRIDRIEQGPTWRPELRSVTIERERPTRIFTETVGRHGIRMEETERRPPDGSGRARLVRRIADPSLPFGGEWIFELEELAAAGAAGGPSVRLVLTEHGVVRNPIVRFLAARLMGHGATLTTYLANLRTSFAPARAASGSAASRPPAR